MSTHPNLKVADCLESVVWSALVVVAFQNKFVSPPKILLGNLFVNRNSFG